MAPKKPVVKKESTNCNIYGINKDIHKQRKELAQAVYTDEVADLGRLKTGIIPFDILTNGGVFNSGGSMLIWGAEGCGKSSLLLQLCKQMIEQHGKRIQYIDIEGGVRNQIEKFGLLEHYQSKMFVPITRLATAVEIEAHLEGTIECMDTVEGFLPPDIIIIDSMSSIIEDTLLNGSINDTGALARNASMITLLLKKIRLLSERRGLSFWMVGQERANMDFSPNPNAAKFKISACKALLHHPDMLLHVKKGTLLKKLMKTPQGNEEVAYGQELKLEAKKNRANNANVPITAHLLYGKGLSSTLFIMNLLINQGYITNKGAWYYTTIVTPPEGKETWSLNGKNELAKWVQSNIAELYDILEEEGAFELCQDI